MCMQFNSMTAFSKQHFDCCSISAHLRVRGHAILQRSDVERWVD